MMFMKKKHVQADVLCVAKGSHNFKLVQSKCRAMKLNVNVEKLSVGLCLREIISISYIEQSTKIVL